MERIRDSIRASCSSPFNFSTGLPFRTSPTCQINEVDGQPDLLKDRATLQDRAARKELERVRLRKLLNQGKKKQRRINSDNLVVYSTNGSTVDDIPGTSFNHFHRRRPHVPRKSRSVGYRRKGKSWRAIGFSLFSDQNELPLPSAQTIFEKSAALLSVQHEIEIELEVAEVLSGLKKQVPSPEDLMINDYVKSPVENEDNQPISVNTNKRGSIAHGRNLTASQVSGTPMEIKHPAKFVIDLNEPPPVELSLEEDGIETLSADPKAEFNEEVKSVPEEAKVRKLVFPWKMKIKDDLDLASPDDNKNERKRAFHKQQKGDSHTPFKTDLVYPKRESSINLPQRISLFGNLNDGEKGLEFYSHNTKHDNNSIRANNLKIHKPLQTGRMMAGPLIFPLNQSQCQTGGESVCISFCKRECQI